MKRLLPLFLLVLAYTNTFSQLDERVFFQLGGTLGADVTQSSGIIGLVGDKLTRHSKEFNNMQINYASIIFTGRLNFLEFSNNASMSLGTHPTFSIGRAYNDVGGGGNMWIRIPGFLEVNFGAGATVSTRKDFGFGLGLGVQYSKYPLFNSVIVADYVGDDRFAIKTNWVSPALQMGFKFFGDHYYCREINMRASYISKNKLENNLDDMGIADFQSIGVMISFLQYLNY